MQSVDRACVPMSIGCIRRKKALQIVAVSQVACVADLQLTLQHVVGRKLQIACDLPKQLLRWTMANTEA